jgi:hypothetical protein
MPPRKTVSPRMQRSDLIVYIAFNQALSKPATMERISWPEGMPLPQHGDAVVVGTLRGFVTHLAYHPTKGEIVVNTR